MALVNVFVNVILPVFLIAGAGLLIMRFRPLPAAPLSQAALYIFAPALSFQALATSDVPVADIGRIALFTVGLQASLISLTWLVSRVMRLDLAITSSMLMGALFMNAINYPLPVILLAFGQEALGRAVVFGVIESILVGTLGVFLASRSSAGLKQALLSVFKLPMGYAAIGGLLVSVFDITVPKFAMETLRIMAGAAIPTMLIVLGVQLYQQGLRVTLPHVVGAVALIRLGASVAIAYGLTLLLGMDPLTQKILLVDAAMPTAVITIVLATEFKGRPDLLTSVVMVTTVLSVGTVTTLLSVLGVSPSA